MKKRILKCSLISIFLIVFLIVYKILNDRYGFGIPCPFHKITGLYCPGCGITRSIFALLEGNIKGAFRYNQLVFCLLPFLLFYIIYHIYIYIVDKKDEIFTKIPNYIYIILLIITIGFGVIRNIPYFTFLRP